MSEPQKPGISETLSSIALALSSLIKLTGMPFALTYLALEKNDQAIYVMSAMLLVSMLERFYTNPKSRIFSGIANRFAFLPMLIAVAWREVASSGTHFPFLAVLGSVFILLKEIFFLFAAFRFLWADEEYLAPKGMRALNSIALAVVIGLYTLNKEPYSSLAMIALLVITFIDGFGFLWNFFKKRRGIKDLNLATKITSMRLLMSPVFLIVYFYDRNPNFADNSTLLQILAVALAVFLIATDGLDGYFARKRNEVTKFGKYLDPFSDKICTMTIFLCFVASNYVPVWMVALVFYREMAVDVIRTLAAAENVVIAARPSGKWKTALQGTVIITILVLATVIASLERGGFASVYPDIFSRLLFIWNYVPSSLMGLVTLVTVLSGIDYLVASKDILDKYFK